MQTGEPPGQQPAHPQGQQPSQIEAARQAVRAQIEQVVRQAAQVPALPAPMAHQLAFRTIQQEIELREKYANWLLILLSAQLVIVNLVFVAYAWFGKDWNLDAVAINV